MADLRQVTAAHMAAMVRALGCLDAAAETIAARWGAAAAKGTISKKMQGQLDWTLSDAIALEDALGRYPVTRAMAQRLDGVDDQPPGDLIDDSATIARESGEAVAAILSIRDRAPSGQPTEAIREIDEAIEALQASRARLATGRGGA